MEDGMAEDEAVKALGNIDDIVSGIMYDMSIPVLAKTTIKRSKEKAANKGLWVTLAIVGSPVWFPLLIAFSVVIFALYLVVWALIASLYAVVVSFGVAAAVSFLGAIVLTFVRSLPVGIFLIGLAFVCGSLCLFTIKPVVLMTKGLIRLSKTMMHGIKSLFINGREKSYENE